MSSFRSWSIRTKLMASMLLCLTGFMLISLASGIALTRRALESMVVNEQLPAVMSGARGEVQRQIAGPVAAARSMADNAFLLQWEAAGQPDEGLAAYKAYAARVKALNQAGSVSWVSATTRRYINETGVVRTVGPDEKWFDGFIAGRQPFALNFDKDKNRSEPMLFVNARFEAAPGRVGSAGLGLSLAALADKIKAYRIGETGGVLLARPDGTVIVHRDPAVADGKHRLQELPGFGETAVATLFKNEPYVHAEQAGEGGPLLLAASYVPELNVYVVGSVPKAELLATVTRAAWTGPLIGGVVGGALALVMIVVVSRALAAPVARAATLLQQIADGDGDLSRRMAVESDDEIGRLGLAFNRFVESLQLMVRQIRQSAESISTATAEVATGNLDLSGRTEQASSSLQQTAAAMCQITEQVRSNAAHANEADALARVAHEASTRGRSAMDQLERTMAGIDQSSRRIGEIIGVIDGIAFQTNILALNAAVEAARAGEQGRGFAVVAAEVRSLAQRSAQAAREVRSLIVASVEQAQGGTGEVRAAGQTMREVLDAATRVSSVIEGISASTSQQSTGIAEINTAVAQLDAMTQQNAALVEQGSAAAESLRDQASQLLAAASRFKLA